MKINEKQKFPHAIISGFKGTANRQEFILIKLSIISSAIFLATLFTFAEIPEFIAIMLLALFAVLGNFFSFRNTIRRLNDIGWSRWWCLTIIIPLINTVFILALAVIPGNKKI